MNIKFDINTLKFEDIKKVISYIDSLDIKLPYYKTLFLNMNKIDKVGWNALMYASYLGELDMVEYLVDNGIDINIKDKQNRTAYDIVKHFRDVRYRKIVNYLKEKMKERDNK